MTILREAIEQVKARLAVCQDIEEAAALYADCRAAEAELMQATNIAADLAERLTRRVLVAQGKD